MHDMLAAGLNCVQYKNGARHTLSDYAETPATPASEQSFRERAEASGMGASPR